MATQRSLISGWWLARSPRALVTIVVLSATGVLSLSPQAFAITVTIDAVQIRVMEVPATPRYQPRRERALRRGYLLLVKRAEAVCRNATSRARKQRMPAVTGSRVLVRRFNRSRNSLSRRLRRAGLPPAPRLRDFGQVRRLAIVRRLRRSRSGRRITVSTRSARLPCRFD